MPARLHGAGTSRRFEPTRRDLRGRHCSPWAAETSSALSYSSSSACWAAFRRSSSQCTSWVSGCRHSRSRYSNPGSRTWDRLRRCRRDCSHHDLRVDGGERRLRRDRCQKLGTTGVCLRAEVVPDQLGLQRPTQLSNRSPELALPIAALPTGSRRPVDGDDLPPDLTRLRAIALERRSGRRRTPRLLAEEW